MPSEADVTYGFNRNDASNLLRQLGQRDFELVPFEGEDQFPGVYVAVTPSGGIPARSGTTLGTATCTLQQVSYAGTLSSTTRTVTVSNLSTTAVGGSAYIICQRVVGGGLVAVWEDCDA